MKETAKGWQNRIVSQGSKPASQFAANPLNFRKHPMTMKGGNTESLYKLDGKTDGRLLMAQSLQQQHPDVTKITWKWGRWQHQVDYRPFKGNRLIRRPGVVIPEGNNEYGMKLVRLGESPTGTLQEAGVANE